ncbi:MAG: hypothetical protein JRH07_00610, partial [Deltaproteobacteria bacterium]|nr:hypothetical protein [Deltaproteobacteria bacterium]
MGRRIGLIVLLIYLSLATFDALCQAADTGLEKDMQRALSRSRLLVARIQTKLNQGHPVTSELNRLRALTGQIRATHLLLQERFRVREQSLNTMGGPKATERHAIMTEAYREALDQYLGLVETLPPERSLSPEALGTLKALLDRILPRPRRPILGSLPYRNLDYPSREPLAAPPIKPAYKGGDRQVLPDDLGTTPEAPITGQIARLAESLGWNPVSIYEWVKNNIETEWYWGLMKGAEETLSQGSGNDSDQAALLVALLRASGFPSRYVRGTIEFFPDMEKANNLIGLEDEQDVAVFLQKAGIPYRAVIKGGKIANFQIEHIWVESRIPYANYRGVVIDEYGKTWLGLDTSIKVTGYTYSEPEQIPWATGLQEVRDDYLSHIRAETPLEYLRAEIQDRLDQNQPGKTYEALLSTKTLIPEELKILPASLQFSQIAITHEYTEIPEDLMHRARFVATGPEGGELFDITLEAFRLSNRTLTLGYEPETVEDQETINSYGGLDNTPSYLVRLRPVLKADGQRLAIGRDGLPMGEQYVLRVDLISPNGVERVTNTQIAGNLSVMGFVCQRAVLPGDVPQEEKGAERLLYVEAINYIDRWNRAEEELASLFGLTLTRPVPTVATVGGVIDVTYLLDTPHGLAWKGIYVDSDLRATEVVGGFLPEQEGASPRLFMELSALEGSILENRVLEDDLAVESISTAKLFALARTRGIPITTIDTTNIDEILPGLPVSDNIKEDITDAVNQGLTVRIPDQELIYEDWMGTGYIEEDPVTGGSGWMLSGGISGGMTVWAIVRWLESVIEVFAHPFSGPPNTDPQSAVYIEKLAGTDMQRGRVGQTLARPLQVLVRDRERRPVKGAEVTFTVKAGGGRFSNGETTITVETDFNGIASADLLLGEKTSDNPAMWWESGYTYAQQVGENIVDASLVSGLYIRTPFLAYGFPGEPHHMRKTHPKGDDRQEGSILSLVGFVSVAIEDEYDNPISNLPVSFLARPVEDPRCIGPDEERKSALLVRPGDPCLQGVPTHGQCESGTTSIDQMTSQEGAGIQVFLGAVPDADYEIEVSSGGLGPVAFWFHSYGFGSCDGIWDPSIELLIKSIHPTDPDGNNINAGRVGSSIPVMARLYLLRETEKEQDVLWPCGPGPSEHCYKVVGTRQYYIDTAFDSASVRFDGQQGSPEGEGIYRAMYELTDPGKKTITIHGEATKTIRESIIDLCWAGAQGCSIVDTALSLSGDMTIEVFGVEIQTEPVLIVPVDQEGYTTDDYPITYTILPPEYKALTANVVILEDGEPMTYIPSETRGRGVATISRGFRFDPESSYEAQVVLNAGTGVEIRTDPIGLNLAPIYIEKEDPEFPGVDLRWDDYYPALGERMIVIRADDPGRGSFGGRKILAEILSPEEGASLGLDPFT